MLQQNTARIIFSVVIIECQLALYYIFLQNVHAEIFILGKCVFVCMFFHVLNQYHNALTFTHIYKHKHTYTLIYSAFGCASVYACLSMLIYAQTVNRIRFVCKCLRYLVIVEALV